ncbi:MAG: protein-L-isoaspartate O-methyltransferase, partial [Mariniphaga sp.]|nr:protein-L-isoaspartate O-methyltransferase [Mariniphaga sp.]
TLERQMELFQKTQALLPEMGYFPACFFGDGWEGLPNLAPFDKILVTAGTDRIPDALKSQLKIGGRMVIPVGHESRQEMLSVVRTSEEEFKTEKHGGFVFVPLLKGTVNH